MFQHLKYNYINLFQIMNTKISYNPIMKSALKHQYYIYKMLSLFFHPCPPLPIFLGYLRR